MCICILFKSYLCPFLFTNILQAGVSFYNISEGKASPCHLFGVAFLLPLPYFYFLLSAGCILMSSPPAYLHFPSILQLYLCAIAENQPHGRALLFKMFIFSLQRWRHRCGSGLYCNLSLLRGTSALLISTATWVRRASTQVKPAS